MIDFSRSLYFHREGRGILTGQSNPNETPGFDQSVDHAWTERHLDAAMMRFPLLARAGLLREWAGLYEVTPDAHPVIDRLSDPAGFYIVAGFQRPRLHARPHRRPADRRDDPGGPGAQPGHPPTALQPVRGGGSGAGA